jgi:hypothetical protein
MKIILVGKTITKVEIKKINMWKSSQIKQIEIKRQRTKCKEITNWKIVFNFCKISTKIETLKKGLHMSN